MFRKARLFRSLAIGAPLLIFSSVAAKEATQTTPAQIEQLYACRALADAAARLDCYDRNVADMEAAAQRGDISFADRETMQERRRGLFGFSLPNVGALFGGNEEDELREIETSIASLSSMGRGRFRIEMANGSIWVQTESIGMARDPEIGDPVKIKAGALGSYFISVKGRKSFRAQRER